MRATGTTVSKTMLSVLLIMVFLYVPLGAAQSVAIDVTIDVPIVFTQLTPATGISRIVMLTPGSAPEHITPTFFSALHPEVSYDGTRILFAGKKQSNDDFDIFEINIDGSDIRQLTSDFGDCREPFYLARAAVNPPLFDDPVRWIGFTRATDEVVDELGRGPLTSLYVTNIEEIKGREPVLWQTTYSLGNDVSPTVLRDGRVLYTSYWNTQAKLMTLTWAGDNANLFRNPVEAKIQVEACELAADRSIVFVECCNRTVGGDLVMVSLRRPLFSREVLAESPGRFRTPHPSSQSGLLVSFAAGDENFGIYTFDMKAKAIGKLVFDDPAYDNLDAQEIRAHQEPIARIPMLEFASVLDIEGFSEAGQLHCMSVYDSDEAEIRRLAPGSVKWARFVEGIGVDAVNCRGGDESWPPPCVETRVLGDAPVETDGSFFVNITGNIPFYIELLDEKKDVLHTMTSWMWVRSKSQRGCIGCHENKELAPQNRATEALLKMQPTTLIGKPGPTMVSSHNEGHE